MKQKPVFMPGGKHARGRRRPKNWRLIRRWKRKEQRRARKMLRLRLGRRYPR